MAGCVLAPTVLREVDTGIIEELTRKEEKRKKQEGPCFSSFFFLAGSFQNGCQAQAQDIALAPAFLLVALQEVKHVSLEGFGVGKVEV